jgi:hypothetical protein
MKILLDPTFKSKYILEFWIDDTVEVIPAPKELKQVEQLLVVPSVITKSEGTQTVPINEDPAHYLIVQKALASQLQVEVLKNEKLTQELDLSRLETVK